MSHDIRHLVTGERELLAFGEPTHAEPAFAQVRNDLFARLVEHGFRSIALESDRIAAFVVDDFVREGVGTFETVMSEGFSHGAGERDANRQLVAWMREYNQHRPPQERLSFHGFDAPTENFTAPSPRPYLERARDYLGLDLDLAPLVGDDDRWSRPEAVLDPIESPGATPEAERLRSIADDLHTALYARAPELIATTSRTGWIRAEAHLTAGLGLLRYHGQCARRIDETARISGLLATRDALMARNLLDLRQAEADRGPTLVFAHNAHLQGNRSTMRMRDRELSWCSAGAIVKSLVGDRYAFVAGSLGRSGTIGLGDPEADTYEGVLQSRTTTWSLTPPATLLSARPRTDSVPRHGYFPLDRAILDTADAVLHIADAPLVAEPGRTGVGQA